MWNARSIQFVWFPTVIDGLSTEKLYRRLVGESPDSTLSNKAPVPKAPFLSRAIGVVEALQYTVQVAPGRLDFIVKAFVDEDEPTVSQPTFDFKDKLDTYVAAFDSSFADEIGEVTRLSIISNLISGCEDLYSANELFLRVCPLPISGDNTTDLLVQVNKRKNIYENTALNHLVKYSSEITRMMTFHFDKDTGEARSGGPASVENFAVAVSLDFNTVPTGEKFSSEEQVKIMQKIASEAIAFSVDPSVKRLQEAS